MSDSDQIVRLREALANHQRKPRARSTGPKTAEGKARSAANAVTHGLSAEVVRDPAERRRLEERLAELREDLQPVGRMEEELVRRIAFALHGLERADRFESDSFAAANYKGDSEGALLVANKRCLHAIDTVVRYGSAADAKLWRSLRALKALQADRKRERTLDLEPAAAGGVDAADHRSEALDSAVSRNELSEA